MRAIWSRLLIILAMVAMMALVFLHRFARQKPEPLPPVSTNTPLAAVEPEQDKKSEGTEPGANRRVLSETERIAFKEVFETKLKPAVEAWGKVYAGHIPLHLENLTADHLAGKIARSTYCMYTFVLDGTTIGVEDANGIIRLTYFNSPKAKKLLELPNGSRLDASMPITSPELCNMLKVDSGAEIPASEIRMKPTAFMSALGGGAYVTVGGDPVNIASWKFTLVFGPDGNLTYYHRGLK